MTPLPVQTAVRQAADRLGTRLAKRGLVARAARAYRRCARVALQYSPTHACGERPKEIFAERALAREGSDGTLSFYVTGEPGKNFEDLCAGPHVPSTGKLKNFKVLSMSGAYWHGDQNSDQLTRVYGTCFADKEGLETYLKFLEEAEKRDHRKIGKEMDLYHIEDHSPGMVFWHPKGTKMVNALKDYIRGKIDRRGYLEVITPEIVNKTLWIKSGHADKYNENMFKTQAGDVEMAVKPMNCPCHIQIFNTGLRSWRDLPMRLADCEPEAPHVT